MKLQGYRGKHHTHILAIKFTIAALRVAFIGPVTYKHHAIRINASRIKEVISKGETLIRLDVKAGRQCLSLVPGEGLL